MVSAHNFTQRIKGLLVLLLASVLLLTTGCVQVEISGLPTEHYLIVQPPTDSQQLLDCTAIGKPDDGEPPTLTTTTALDCHPIALTVHH